MKTQLALYISLFFSLSSCTALKTLSSKDHSSAAGAQAERKKDITFIDGISVTPGAVREPAAVVKGKRSGGYNAPEVPKRINTVYTKPSESNIAALQVKYASILDVSPEKLNNITLLQSIDHWWGTQYCMGGSTEDCIDCSGYSQIIMRDVYGINVPRKAEDMYDSTARISTDELTEGDLVFFHTTGRGHSITHVGVYIANNRFTHAATSGGVTISSLDDPYWKPRYRGAGRVRRA